MRALVRDVALWYDVLTPSVEISGDRLVERPVLIGVHGGPGVDSTAIAEILRPLGDVAQLVRYDQRGHGRSDRSTPQHWHLARWADDLRGFCDVLGVEKPIVFGGSLGGAVALTYAARHPSHPRGLVAGYVGARNDFGANVEAFRRLGGEEAARVAQADVEDPSEEHLAEFLRVCLPLYSRRPGAVEYFRRRRMLSIETPEVTVAYMRSHPGGEALVDLDRVRCPVLVLAGEDDPVVPPATVTELVEGLRHAPVELVMLPDCGHTVFRDQPEIAYGTVRGFLNRLATGSSGGGGA